MPKRDRVREIEVEVIPPGKDVPRPAAGRPRADGDPIPAADPARVEIDDPFIAFVARMMDSVISVPGTRIRIGLDPIIGMIPGIGDTATALTSLMLILKSARYGLPRIVIARMVLNVLINSGVGAIPVFGDLFSVWFRSNVRNYDLLRRFARPIRPSTRPDWTFVVGMVLVTILMLGFVFAAAVAWFNIFVNFMNLFQRPGAG